MSALSETVQIICLYPPPAVSNAGSIIIQNSSIEAVGNGSERIALWGGDTVVNDSQIHLFNESATDADPAKYLDIHAYSLNLDNAADIATEAHNSGKGANVNAQTTGVMNILNDSVIGTRTFADATAGDIDISTGKNLNILGLAKWPVIVTGIRSLSDQNSTGNAGNVSAYSQESINLARGSGIHSRTEGLGNSGTVKVTSNESIIIDGTVTDKIIPTDSGPVTINTSGTASSIKLDVQRGSLSTIDASSRSLDGSIKGDAGTVIVNAKNISIYNGAHIGASAFAGSGNAGNVIVTANSIKIANNQHSFDTGITASVNSSGRGYAGTITVNTRLINMTDTGTYIKANSIAGDAGNITLATDILRVDGKNPENKDISGFTIRDFGGVAGITAVAQADSTGNAGIVTINAETVELFGDAGIDAGSYGGTGSAGTVILNTKTLLLDSYSSVGSGSGEGFEVSIGTFGGSGKTGGVAVKASDWIHLNNNSIIGIKNSSTVKDIDVTKINPGFVNITTPEIILKNSSITTESTGNVEAGNIYINFTKSLNLDPSFIATTANTGSGGDIFINGNNGTIFLDNSGFLTSVSGGVNSHGGDINVTAGTLIMNTGVIQANAVGGTGGDINLNLQNLIPSQNNLIVGGSRVDWQPFQSGLNVIQAASASGVNGSVNITSPQFNISGSISGLNVNALAPPDINRNPCRNSAGNSLKRRGKGGLPIDEQKDDFIPRAAVKNLSKTSESNPSTENSITPMYFSGSASLAKNNAPCAAIK